MIKPLAREQARLTKRIRMDPTLAAPAPIPDEEDEGMGEGRLGNMLEKIINGKTPIGRAMLVTPVTSRIVSAKKKCLLPPTPIMQKKPTAHKFLDSCRFGS